MKTEIYNKLEGLLVSGVIGHLKSESFEIIELRNLLRTNAAKDLKILGVLGWRHWAI